MWSKQISPDGKTYYFNHVTFESSWVMPEELAAFEGPRKEIVVECKLIPKTEWRICLTNLDHEFFYNQHSKAKSWDIPEEILEIVGELLQDAMSEDEDEGLNEEENEKEDSDSISADELVEKRDPPEESEVCQTKRAKYDVSETEIIENSNFSHEAALDDKVVQPKTKMTEKEIENEFLVALEVNNVSPFSSWAIESDKLKHDSRIIALNDKKKQKQLFDNWCIEKSEKLLAEQKSSQKDSKAGFLDLLSEQVINPRFRYDDFCRRFKKDLRFMKFEDLKERQILFERQILNLKESLKAEARKNFLEMLKESKLHVFSTWMETSMKLENDPRFETLKNPIDRENQFRNFIKGLRKSEQN